MIARATAPELTLRALSCAALLSVAPGCRQHYVDADDNRLPIAVARAFDVHGEPVDSSANNGRGPIYPFHGEPVEVKLDARGSSDEDGTIAGHRWLSATLDDDGGADRVLPDGEEPGWPEDVAQPRVQLGEGSWSFTLWVTDDDGAISDPATLRLIVGDAPEIDAGPAPVMCMAKVCDPKVMLPGVGEPSEACCDMDSGGACGAVIDTMGGCEAVDQPGTDDPACPGAMSAAGTMLAGCCTPARKCGLRSGTLRGCIERSDYPTGFLMSMAVLGEMDCGGT